MFSLILNRTSFTNYKECGQLRSCIHSTNY